ncbi:MAG: nitrous oxide reductase family maturation protein NosD [Rhizobiaceae bacterium]|nr:MAG: nitrous oxide reductase family maturation protein NosD [Rhizobiaceae bacterium]CAG0984102.1 putative ABC transporter binding protein NosD [Rhizobiaceae bacterium]
MVHTRFLRSAIAALVIAAACAVAVAGERVVPAEPGALARAVAEAEPGDVLLLEPGRHDGPVVLDRPVTLDGAGRAIVQGNGEGSVIVVTGTDVTVRGLEIRGSGSSHQRIDSGVRLIPPATRARIEDNRIVGNLHGVDVHGALDSVVTGNTIVGRTDFRMNDRGNGIYVWKAPGTVIEGNDISFGRDGIFSNASSKGTYRNNLFRDLRFAVHYMYTNDSEVSGNVSIGNHLGFALMFSNRIVVHDNLSLRDRAHGFMLNYANNVDMRGNLVRGGTEKCTFIYNAHRNAIVGNRFENCEIGIHFTAGSERNRLGGNAFIGNRNQVKYVGTRYIEWSDGGRGNYWSDHPAFDLDGDGLADSPFRPNDLMDHILWSQPAAKLLLGSPAVQLVRWSQATFPAILPGGVVDSHPLMAAPEIAVPAPVAEMEAAAQPAWLQKRTEDADLDPVAGH